MIPGLLWALLAAAVVLIVAMAWYIAVANARAKARSDLILHTVAKRCASDGHAYRVEESAWRCVECGNFVPRVEGEVYGPTENGLRERRLEGR